VGGDVGNQVDGGHFPPFSCFVVAKVEFDVISRLATLIAGRRGIEILPMAG